MFTNPAPESQGAAPAYTANLLALLGSRDPLEVQSVLRDEMARRIAGLAPEAASQPEAPGKWSVLGVLHHLIDTEMVYGYRIRMILTHDSPPIQGYDQDIWAQRLRYDSGTLEDLQGELDTLRKRNLRLYRSLEPAELERLGVHSERGPESVETILRMVAAHDLVHLRQIDRILETVAQA